MKIYIVLSFNDRQVKGAYTNKEDAEKAVKEADYDAYMSGRNSFYFIEELELK